MNLYKIDDQRIINLSNHIYDYLSPNKIYIPIKKRMTFKKNTYIYKNTYYDEYLTSISGTISGYKKILLQKKYLPALEITNDFKENMASKLKTKKITNREELIRALKDNHFNSIVEKLLAQEHFTNLIISSIDEEKYNVRELTILKEYYEEIIETIELLQKILKVSSTLIVAKNTSSESIKKVKSILGTYPSIEFVLTADKYLLSYPDFLCEYLNIFPNDTLILKTSEVYDLYLALIKKRCLDTLIVALTGDALKKSKIIRTKVGVSLEELVNNYGEFITNDYEIYLNGYLKGWKVNKIEDIIMTPDIDTVVFNVKKDVEEEKCINCGACLKVCPMHINVKLCYLKNVGNSKCLGCGLCSYICPAKLSLKEIVMSEENASKND